MREKFKKGEIVSATRTFNGEIITGEFLGYHLFNDENPDTVVGIVDVPGDRVYDVDVTSLKHYVKSTRYSDDEKIRNEIIDFFRSAANGQTKVISGANSLMWADWLEKQKEQKPVKSIFPPGLGEAHFNPISVVEQKPEEWVLPNDFEEAVYKVANFISPFNSQEELRKVSHRFAEQLLDMAKKEQKPAEWSEEDENTRHNIIARLESLSEYETQYLAKAYLQKEISWLKSLRPSWKPSKEQIGLLGKVYNLIWADPATPADVQDGLGDFIEQLRTL